MQQHAARAGALRRQLVGARAIAAALDAGEPVQLLLAAHAPHTRETRALLERARALGIAVRGGSARARARLSSGDPEAEVLALLGPAPRANLDATLKAGGALWQLVGLAYPGNTGFAIRTAEVSGADGVVVDCDFDHGGRREALRAAMRADHFLPVFWERALDVLPRARAAGRALWAIEDSGDVAPWDLDLTGPRLFVLGGERHGIPRAVLDACDRVLRIPMRGFIPSYNVQAAMAMVAGERLRQLRAQESPPASAR